jgi:hypothetical protein
VAREADQAARGADPTIHSVSFSEAKAGLSALMTDVVHGGQLELIERHGGKEAALLVSRDDLLALLSGYRFQPRVVFDGAEVTASLEDLGVLGLGGDFEEAMEDLVRELRRYAHRFFMRRAFYMETDRARHAPFLLRFALTPADEQLDLLYGDSQKHVEQSFREAAAASA